MDKPPSSKGPEQGFLLDLSQPLVNVVHPHTIDQNVSPAELRTVLTLTTIEGGRSDLLLDKLEDNYFKERHSLYNIKEKALLTPIKFLSIICQELGMILHLEEFRFEMMGTDGVQLRTELFAGKFCGVAHAQNQELCRELAAAHVLQRMTNYFRHDGLDSGHFALMPGIRYTQITQKMQKAENPDRLVLSASTSSAVYHDWDYGVKYATAKMLKWGFPNHGGIQVKDYYAMGAECPKLREINHPQRWKPASANKLNWMAVNKVEDMDLVLHDQTDSSSYLSFGKGLDGYGRGILDRVLDEIRMKYTDNCRPLTPAVPANVFNQNRGCKPS